jgi:phosphonate transport system substrate-binding protein
MGQRLGRPVRLFQRTYAEVNDLVKNREIDLAFVCAGALVEGEHEFGMQALVVPQMRGETLYYSYLVVNRRSGAERLADLRGKTFAFSDPLSNSGRLVPVYQLALRRETPERFFSRTVFTSHDNSILAVADGLVDGAAVDSLITTTSAPGTPRPSPKHASSSGGDRMASPVSSIPTWIPTSGGRCRVPALHPPGPHGQRILDRLLIDRFVEVPRSLPVHPGDGRGGATALAMRLAAFWPALLGGGGRGVDPRQDHGDRHQA